ncbi:hypothetical protein EDD22DRAFT_955083 [Suillus occidentalis]|nr:hypothetical protein EDD22DRAFT_955083 [Suillus occidentalis]
MYTGRQPFHFLNAPTNASQSPGFDTSDLPDPNVLDGPPMGQGQSSSDFDNQPASSNETVSLSDPSFYNTQTDNLLPTSGSNDQFPDLSTGYYEPPAAITFPDDQFLDDTFLDAQMGGQSPSTIFSGNQPTDLNVYDSQPSTQPSPIPLSNVRLPDATNISSSHAGIQLPPHQDISWPPDASSHSGPPPPYLHGLPPPVLSNDGISSVPVGFEVVPQFRLGESSLPPKVVLPPSSRKRRENRFITHPTHPYQHRQKFKRRAKAAEVPSDAGPSMGPSKPGSESGQFSYLPSCLGPLSALNKCSLLEEGERRQEVRAALLSVTSAYDQESGKVWTTMNEGALYRTLSVPSGNITSSCKKITRNKVQSGYALRPSIWSDESEPTYVKRNVKVLTAESPFPPRYIFGQDEDGNWHAFEHEVL